MENASKALIMAGGVLLGIMLISITVLIRILYLFCNKNYTVFLIFADIIELV